MFFWKRLRRFLFLWDAETVHHWTVWGLRFLSRCFGRPALHILSGEPVALSTSVEPWGMAFHSPIGLAAGFDKNADLLDLLPDLGFGFAEIGTVTPRAQPGNPKPRLFRNAQEQLFFNRMGFNNEGATAVARKIEQARIRGLPQNFRVGINIGKNKDTPDGAASTDYSLACAPFAGLVDYVVINVSSPNTPGLRALQTLEALLPIVHAVLSQVLRWKNPVPVLLKLAPELTKNQEDTTLFENEKKLGIQGWVLTNTWGGEHPTLPIGQRAGGWSGKILTEPSYLSLVNAKKHSQLPIISVGGILSGAEANRRLQAGASLIQVYSGWIFNGPRFPSQITEAVLKTKNPGNTEMSQGQKNRKSKN